MLILKNSRGIAVARAELTGAIHCAEKNREIIQWLRHCPEPSIVRFRVDGEATDVRSLRAGHLDFQRSLLSELHTKTTKIGDTDECK